MGVSNCWSGAPAANPSGIQPIPVNYVLHQAALGSVPRSLTDPLVTNDNNSGFLNVIPAHAEIQTAPPPTATSAAVKCATAKPRSANRSAC